MFQNFLRRCSQIAMPTIGRRKSNFSFARDLADSPPERSSADLQCPLFPGRKRTSGEKYRSLRSLFHWPRTKVFRYQTHLFKLLGGGGYGIGSLGKGLHYYEDSNCRFSCPFLQYSRKILF